MSAATRTAAPWPGEEVPLAKVERTLRRQYQELTGQRQVGSRTRVANLVSVAGSPDAGRAALDLVQGLHGRNPSRSIVLVKAPQGTPAGVRAFARVVHQPGTRRRPRRVFDEVVVEAAIPSEHLAAVVLPLLLPEIPVFTWWLETPPFGHPELTELLAVTDRLIVDSARFADPFADLGGLAQGLPSFPPTTDCGWGRLTPWRQALATVFDCQPLRPAIGQVTGVTVAAGAPAAGLLLIGWLASRLDWRLEEGPDAARTARYVTPGGSRVTAELATAVRAPALQRVHLTVRTGDGPETTVGVDPVGDHLVAAVTAAGRPVSPPCVAEGPLTRTQALQAELATFGRDRIYEQALAATLPWTTTPAASDGAAG